MDAGTALAQALAVPGPQAFLCGFRGEDEPLAGPGPCLLAPPGPGTNSESWPRFPEQHRPPGGSSFRSVRRPWEKQAAWGEVEERPPFSACGTRGQGHGDTELSPQSSGHGAATGRAGLSVRWGAGRAGRPACPER